MDLAITTVFRKIDISNVSGEINLIFTTIEQLKEGEAFLRHGENCFPQNDIKVILT